MRSQQVGHALGLLQGAHKRHHHLHIGQAHLGAHALHGFAFHRKGFTEVFADVTCRTTETKHGVFFFRLVAAAANEFAVFVGFEI